MTAQAQDTLKRDDALSQQYRCIAPPRRAEGIANALCAAFEPAEDGIPRELNDLLQQLR